MGDIDREDMNGKNLTILQVNDSHAYLDLHIEHFWGAGGDEYRLAGGYARLAALVSEIRSQNEDRLLFLDNGDTLHGTYPAVQTQGKALIPILNRLGLHGMTAHWEFAYGPQTFLQRASELNYPVLALNVFRKADGERVFQPFRVMELNGVKIGIAGLANPIVDKLMPPSFSEGLSFDLGREELYRVVRHLRQEEQVDLVVLLSHLGFPQDMQLISEVEGIDVCLSGHTHNRLYRPVCQGDTLVIQSGSHGAFLGCLELSIEAGKVVDYRHELLEVHANIQPDNEIQSLLEEVLEPFQSHLEEVVGETESSLNRAYSLETSLDNLLLEALIESTGAQVAFSNGWRYGAPVAKGPVTLNDLYNIVPMNPPVSLVEMSGAEIREMLEQNLEHTFARQPYNQMGGYVKRALGIKVFFKVENPYPTRIQEIYIGKNMLKSGASYQAAFVTEQGVPSKYGRQRQNSGVNAVDAMRAYLTRHRPYHGGLLGTFVMV
jgi:S-sulfosulfanyl-L-cysteine sulfohydrolase